MTANLVYRAARSFLHTVIVAHLVTEYCVEVTMTVGPSMYPTLSPAGDTLLIDRRWNLPCWIQRAIGLDPKPKVGDIIIARSPSNTQSAICKRVIAVEGEKAPNGKRVPIGRVWIEGDNKSNSTDSRDYGAIPLAMIEGKVICRIWPPSRLGRLEPPKDNKRSSASSQVSAI